MSHQIAVVVKRALMVMRGAQRLTVGPYGLAATVALALLAGLLWLLLGPTQRDAPERGEQTRALVGAAPDLHRPTPMTEASGVTPAQPPSLPTVSEEATEELDTQALHQLLMRLETSRRNPGERLDTRAMDSLLATLDAEARTPSVPRSESVRRPSRRPLPGTATGHERHSFPTSPQRIDTAPLRPSRE